MVSAVTPGAVAPPLLPSVQGSTQGGAYPLGTATLPVLVSQFDPQSTSTPRAFASSKVSGRRRAPSPLAARTGAAAVATTSAAITRTTAGRSGWRPRTMPEIVAHGG